MDTVDRYALDSMSGQMTPRAAEPVPRSYGNWRRPASAGLWNLGKIGTAILIGGLVLVIGSRLIFGLLPAVAVALVVAVFLGLLMLRDRHGASRLTRLGVSAGWLRSRRAGADLYRSGPLGCTGWGRFQLPGLAAATELTEWRDSYGRPFALLYLPSTAHYSVVFSTEPDGASLVDAEQVDSWVAHWGQWLAALGSEPHLVAAAVTVETAPDSGTRLRREVETHLDSDAPSVARQMLAEVVATYPAGAATVRAWVTLTFTGATRAGARTRVRDSAEMSRELASRLPGLTHGLSATGAGAARPVPAGELCELVRTAYDPAAGALFDAARTAGQRPELDWADVGPAAAEARWDLYRHDSAVSMSWTMTAAPRGEVHSSVLAGLLGPHPDIDRKRVTLIYRPLDAAAAARVVEKDKADADFKATSTGRPSARMLAEQRAATAAAVEEARGAGLVNFGLLVTATTVVTDPFTGADTTAERLPAVRAAVDNLAATARLQLRPAGGSQDSVFAAGLPLGLVLPQHLRVPQRIRDNLG